jgi:mono/diheme cytochrome c family protein
MAKAFNRSLIGLAAAAAVFAVACGSDDPAPAAPPEAPATPTEAAPQSFDVAGMSASAYYAANCAACHGQQREGIIGPPLTVEALSKDDAAYVDAIANGVPGTAMIGFSAQGLTATDIETLVAWFRAGAPD